MLKSTIVILLLLLSLWVVTLIYLSGAIPKIYLPAVVAKFDLPRTTSDLGQSFSTVESLLSTLSVTLALVAVIFQGKSIKDSTDAQKQQAEELVKQLRTQERQAEAMIKQFEAQRDLTIISAHSTTLQYLASSLEWNEIIIGRLKEERSVAKNEDTRQKKNEVIESMSRSSQRIRDRMKNTDSEMSSLLNKIIPAG